MKNFAKKTLITIIVIIFIISFSSSYSSLSIDNLAFVVAMGIDASDTKNIRVTFEFVNTPSSSEGSIQNSKIVIDSVDASSVTNAINIMNAYLAKKLDLSHCKMIVFSEEVAQSGVSNYVYSLMNDVQIRPSSNIVISKCSANYYIQNSAPSLETFVTRYYDIFPKSSKYTGYMTNATIGSFFNSLACDYCNPYAILGGLTVSNAGTSSTSSSQNPDDSNIKSGSSSISGTRNSENIGTAVFKDDKLVGELNAIETICLSILRNEVNTFLVTIPSPEEEENSFLDIYLSPMSNTKIDVSIVNGAPYIKVSGKFFGQIYSMSENSKFLQNDVLTSISTACNHYLESVLSEYLYKTSIEFKSDINGFGRYALLHFKTNQDFSDFNWSANYVNSTFDIKIDTTMDSGFLLTQT